MKRGEIWQADPGYSGKVRPVLVLSIEFTDDERAIATYVPRTTSIWEGRRFDVPHKARGMKDGAFAVQLIGSIPATKYLRRIGQVDAATLAAVEAGSAWEFEAHRTRTKRDFVTREWWGRDDVRGIGCGHIS